MGAGSAQERAAVFWILIQMGLTIFEALVIAAGKIAERTQLKIQTFCEPTSKTFRMQTKGEIAKVAMFAVYS